MPDSYSHLIVGTGEAGKFLAWSLAKRGERVAIIERQSQLGGACPNVACLPTKNLIHSAKVASLVREAGAFGIGTGPVTVSMAGVIARKRKMVAELQTIHVNNFKASGAEIVHGVARFVAPLTLEVTLSGGGARTLTAPRVYLNVGSRAAIPAVPGLVEAGPLTHVEALELERLPEHLVVLGGGYVGLEFAQAMRRLGSKVTVVARGPRLLDVEDADVSSAMEELFKDEGIVVRTNAQLTSVSGRSGEAVTLLFGDGTSVAASHLLVATGRVPNTADLNARAGGVELDTRGYIKVDERLETTAKNTFAMGDCTGGPHFTHVSFDDYRIALANATGGDRTTSGRLVPSVLFTDPELAHIGLTEAEARRRGVAYRLARIPAAAALRTRTLSATRGFIKALIADNDRILGFTAFASEASEMLAAVQIVMNAGLPYTVLKETIFAHPSMAEGLTVLFHNPPQAAAPA